MAYQTSDYGPGDIAALPPTIGLTSRGPTIGAELPGKPIPAVSGCGVGGCGVGDNGGAAGWALPLGLILGGGILLWMFTRGGGPGAVLGVDALSSDGGGDIWGV
jgi:hypothetical protein